jgi:hypothetical protein
MIFCRWPEAGAVGDESGRQRPVERATDRFERRDRNGRDRVGERTDKLHVLDRPPVSVSAGPAVTSPAEAAPYPDSQPSELAHPPSPGPGHDDQGERAAKD